MPFLAVVYVDDHTADAVRAGDSPWEGSARTVGLFRWPTNREIGCTGSCDFGGKAAWVRDRMGFMKCHVCGKRNRRVRAFLIGALFDFLGANQYPGAPAAFRTPEGYGGSHADND